MFQESDLIRECIAGDRKAQYDLYNKFSGKMYFVCLRYAANADEAQDILQDGFVKIFKNLEKFRGEGSFEGWVRRIFVNTAIEQLRKKVELKRIDETHENTLEAKDINAISRLSEKDILELIQGLSPGYRTVFNMYEIEGYSHREIGEILGISEGTSKSQLARAKGLLRKEIDLKHPNLNVN
jgi:RNA polymerase sigma factor (sigma-70 family)